MTKIVYNACYGGFGLSEEAVKLYLSKKGLEYTTKERHGYTTYEVNGEYFHVRDIERDDPILVEVVEELGEKADGMCANLQIEELPKGTPYRIEEYDGYESVDTLETYAWRIA